MTLDFHVNLEEGKYTYERYSDGRQLALRHGEPWRDLVGDKFVAAMGYEIERLRDENARLLAERDDADRRAGAAEREQERDREAAYARDSWLRRAKEQWGVGSAISFDVVWGEALELKKDAERLDWLERETHKSSYAVQFRLLRDPEINAGMNRIECTTTVGSGPWQRDVEGATLRAAIDASMQKGSDERP